MQLNPKSKPTGVRGVSWKEQEILDLLSIWGEAKVQEALRASHRNWECFERIANEMMARGHKRTAEECRSKTKTLRLEYRRVVAHNSQLGNTPATCPFYSELHRILHGDAIMKPRRIVRTLKFQTPGEPAAVPAQLQEGSEELSTQEQLTIKQEDITGSTGEEESPGGRYPEHEGTPPQNVVEVTYEETEADVQLSPDIRLTSSRSKRRRVAGLCGVAERLMAHSSQQLERELEARRREHDMELEERRTAHEAELALRRREQETCERMMMEARRESEVVHEALRKNCAILESAVEAFQMFLAQQHPPNNSSTFVMRKPEPPTQPMGLEESEGQEAFSEEEAADDPGPNPQPAPEEAAVHPDPGARATPPLSPVPPAEGCSRDASPLCSPEPQEYHRKQLHHDLQARRRSTRLAAQQQLSLSSEDEE